jgi:hypothetical protein
MYRKIIISFSAYKRKREYTKELGVKTEGKISINITKNGPANLNVMF